MPSSNSSDSTSRENISGSSSSSSSSSSSNSSSTAGKVEDVWKRGLSSLRGELDPQIFAAFLKPLKAFQFDEESQELSVRAPSKLVCNHVEQNFSSKIETALAKELGLSGLRLKISVDEAGPALEKRSSGYVIVKKQKSSLKLDQNKDKESTNLNVKYSFSNFVVGNSNQFCHAAAMHVAEDPGGAYNPLFIYGGVGLGKTHLMHAIGNAALEKDPSKKALYISSETFTNELIQALRFAKMDEFKNRLRNIDVLLIDDIQFMCGKERTQEEFFHTFNALYNSKKQIVMTADKIPQEMPGIEMRLQTRFSWGLAADLLSPDFETRVAILKRKAAFDGFEIPEEVTHFIAEKVSSNVRELEGALTRLHALSSLQNIPMNLESAKTALEPILKTKRIHISIDDIKKVVSSHFHVKVSEVVSKRRTKNLAFPRHVAMFLCRKHTSSSFPEIGTHFGGRDHSSVIHATNVITKRLNTDSDLARKMQEIEAELYGTSALA